ncbi:MAG TPA: hypothetical protein VHF22_07255, partial [Planctomycetota bacterium]|nr:hypothetical protein [Planctomycetota bacterium]
MFCGSCGQENLDHLQFCTGCGAALASQRTGAGGGGPRGLTPRPGGSGGDVGSDLRSSLGGRATGGDFASGGGLGL